MTSMKFMADAVSGLQDKLRKSYQPPPESRDKLGPILGLIHDDAAKTVTPSYNAKLLCRLPGGEVFFESQLAVDTDGSRFAKQDGKGQAQTAWTPGGRSVDSDAVPYFSITLAAAQSPDIDLRAGDIAVVIHKARMAFAVLADFGGANLGEGSLALHRALHHERVVGRGTAHERFHDSGIPGEVLTIAFPRSGVGHPAWATSATIETHGKAAWRKLLMSTAGDFPTLKPKFG